jgi:hypothetical protein
MLTVRDIQSRLWSNGRSAYNLMIPNYTPDRWFECDMFAITKSGYFHEFEIKLTVDDFRDDANKKSKDRWKSVEVCAAAAEISADVALRKENKWSYSPGTILPWMQGRNKKGQFTSNVYYKLERQLIPGGRKYELLEGHSPYGPARFWYVVPDELIKASDVPHWAGLQYVCGEGLKTWLKVIRSAPQLHRRKTREMVADRFGPGFLFYQSWNEQPEIKW